MDKKYFVSKEKYLELREIQKTIAKEGKEDRQHRQAFFKARRQFYHGKGQQVPNSFIYDKIKGYVDADELYGFKFPGRKSLIDLGEYESRYVNIIYGLAKGKQYSQIERKVREGNEVDIFYLERYCKKYGVDFETVKGLVWQTQSSK